MNFAFKPLDDRQLEEAFSVLVKVGQWLESQGRRQRITKTTFESYAHWQAEKANFVVTHNERIAGLVTCRYEHLQDWPDVEDKPPVLMIRALATDPEYQRTGVGRYAMSQVLSWIASANHALATTDTGIPVYLDCVSETLPGFYAKFKFLTVGRQLKTFDDGETFDLTLMRRYLQASTVETD